MSEKSSLRKAHRYEPATQDEFIAHYKEAFYDPTFRVMDKEIHELALIAYKNYIEYHKSPITTKAGYEFQDPDYDLSIQWLETRNRLLLADLEHQSNPSRVLLINGSPRSEHSCPGEISKTSRLVERAENLIRAYGFETEILDLSLLTSDFKKIIHPCKGCVSTAMPLCHWPCSCYPNHAMGQVQDWMADIYEMWVRAHGVMIITPVHWYQVTSPLKMMMDRMVCADGGNPDPTTTHGKNGEAAKKLELKGWDYPKHLAGRAFSVVVHGDAAGLDGVRRNLCDWLSDLKLIQAGTGAVTSSYIGYYEPYATSHYALDVDHDFITEVETAALSLVKEIEVIRTGNFVKTDQGLPHPMQK
jgi:multimeric flavodoxin WrbA